MYVTLLHCAKVVPK